MRKVNFARIRRLLMLLFVENSNVCIKLNVGYETYRREDANVKVIIVVEVVCISQQIRDFSFSIFFTF